MYIVATKPNLVQRAVQDSFNTVGGVVGVSVVSDIILRTRDKVR